MTSIERKHRRTVAILGISLILCIFASFTLGRYPVPLRELLGILGSKLGLNIAKFWTDAMEAAVWNIRLPRVILSVLVGACLAAAGGAYQGVFQNPMASPDILGASAGAGFGAALAILLGASSVGITLGAFAASLVTVALVFSVSRHARGDRVLGLVLAGIMISSLFQSGTSFLKLVADPSNQLPQITYWLMGSLSGASWADVGFVLLPMLAGLIPLLILRWQLNVITMGDDEARAMGVDPQKIRVAIALCSTLVTASAVSVSGMIGWVGLVIPHFVRILFGFDYRRVIPASALMGAAFLTAVDTVARVATTAELPIGILTSFIGAPIFIILLVKGGLKHGT